MTAPDLQARERKREQQDPERQRACSDDQHYWHETANAEGDTCNCGAWYRFANRIERTPPSDE